MQLSSDATTRQAQLTAIKTEVNTNYNGIFDASTAAQLNALATPDFYVWKSVLSLVDTGKSVDLSELGGLTTANSARIEAAFTLRPGGFVPSVQTDRALFGDVFSGAGGANTRGMLMTAWQRKATIAEKVLATGTGTQGTGLGTDGAVTTGSPAVLGDGAEGNITVANLIEADTNG